MKAEDVDRIDDADFEAYCSKLYQYLQVRLGGGGGEGGPAGVWGLCDRRAVKV